MFKRYYLLFLLPLVALACTSESGDSEAEKKYTVTPMEKAKLYPDASIEYFSYRDSMFSFTLNDSAEYKLGVQTPDAPQRMCANSAKGQHIHLILDNEPYSAQYTNEFEYDVANGDHYMLAFLSRSYHESIKTRPAHVARYITVEDGSITGNKEISGPMLFYSRPKGTYVGKADTEKILLDFYLVNLGLGKGYKVKVDINGEQTELIETWQPYSIEGLPMGENTVTLTLVDANGGTVDAPHNPVSRTFTLKEDPAEQ
ncbi:MAG: phosphopeptide-binding protein [Bacteroidetes bacterium]|nr:phosphopeptide-binding protein [Bacteroidota bacterium]